MKLLLRLFLLLLPVCGLHAQRALQKNPTTGALIEGFKSGANTIEFSSTGTLLFNSGFTLAGGAYLKTALSLGNVENTALSTWAGTSNVTTLGTITTGAWQGSVIAPAYLGTGSSISTKYLRGDGTWQTLDLSGYQSLTGTLALAGFGSITGTLPVANGGTGNTSGTAAAGTLTGTQLNSTVTRASLERLDTLTSNGVITTTGGTGALAVVATTDEFVHGEAGKVLVVRAGGEFIVDQVTLSDTVNMVSGAITPNYVQLGTIGSADQLDIFSTYMVFNDDADGGSYTISFPNTSGAHVIAWPQETGALITSGGSGNVSAAMLASTAVTPGSYTTANVTVDADGRITAAASGSSGAVTTWLATPTKANLNAAVSDDDPAYVGAANTFTAAQIVNAGDGDAFKVQRSASDRFKVATTSTSGNFWVGDASYFSHETSAGAWIMKYANSERCRITFAENAYNIQLKTSTTGDNGVYIANGSLNGAYLTSDIRLNSTIGVFKVEANPRQMLGAYTGNGHTLALIGGQAQTTSTGGAGGLLSITGGAAGGSGNNNGGNVTIAGGAATGSGTAGTVTIGTRGSGISAIATVVKAAYDPASIAAGATETTTATLTGAAAGSCYIATPAQTQGLIISATRTGTDTVTITFYNPTASAIDATALDVRVVEIAF